jgi:hypothetical protein
MRTKRVLRKIAALSTGAAMLSGTITGALALSNTLADYPAPFISNGVFTGVLAVGQNAAASDTIGQSVLLADLQTKAVSPSGGTTVTVSGGVSEDIPLGANISDSQTYTHDEELADDDIDSLWDGAITFQGAEYDTEEFLEINQGANAVSVDTSLTSAEDDYQTDVVLEVARDSIKYYYAFSEAITVNKTTSSDPLEIKFLGKTLKITDIDDDAEGKFTAYVGSEFFMDSGDSVVVDGKTVKLVRVGSAGAIVINVDGVTETISSGSTKTVNGIEIVNDETFYDSNNQAASSASLIIGADAQETYSDGDAYVGEDDDNPDWVWNVGNIKSSTVSTSSSSTGEFTGPYFGIENDFIFNDDSDNPPKPGECIDLPNNYVSICLDSLTVSDDNYATYTFEYEDSADLSDVIDTLSSSKTIRINTPQSEGITIERDKIQANGSTTTDIKTDEVWLYADFDNANAVVGAAAPSNSSLVAIFYKDSDNNKVKLAGWADNNSKAVDMQWGFINYDNTKDDDVTFHVDWDDPNDFNLTISPYHSTTLVDNDDNLTMRWAVATGAISKLGAKLAEEEAGELTWTQERNTDGTDKGIGSKDEDQRSRYGIIIRDPKAHGSSDEVVLDVPGDQVEANVVIKGTTAKTTSSGGSVVVNPIPSSAAALSDEVTSASAQHLIVVGGPAVNPLANSVFGLGRDDFTPNEAMIKLADNGANVALLVAGYSAVDTRNAAEAIAAGRLSGMNKAEAKVVSTTQTVGSYTVE